MITASLSRLAPLLLGTAGKQRLNVLIYHRVLAAPDPLQPDALDAPRFEAQMALLSRYFTPLSLDDAFAALGEGRLPERAVAVTFDDGYADNLRVALPLLQKWRVPATVFVATGFLNGGLMWNDAIIEVCRRLPLGALPFAVPGLPALSLGADNERAQLAALIIERLKYLEPDERSDAVAAMAAASPPLPRDLMLTDAELLSLAGAGVGIGAHTVSHPILNRLPADEARREILEGRRALEALLGRPVNYFAYPNGKPGSDYRPEHVEMVRDAGFTAAFSTEWGVVSAASDVFQLPRFTPWDRGSLRFTARLLLNFRDRDNSGDNRCEET